MVTQPNFYNALIDWRFDQPNLLVNGKYILSLEYMNQVLDHLKLVGYSGITLDTNVPIDIQTGKIQTIASYGPDGKPMPSPEDHSLPKTTWSVIDLAKQKGFSVDLKLNIVDVNNDFAVTTKAIKNNFSVLDFFNNVTQYEKDIARLAEQHGVNRIYVGVHQDGFETAEYKPYWSHVINEVKSVYKGIISYEGYYWNGKSPIYDLVDHIGLTFGAQYVFSKPSTDIYEIINSHKSVASQINAIAESYDKPTILVGAHYTAADWPPEKGGFWAYLLSGQPIDNIKADYGLQAARFNGFFNLLSNELSKKIIGVDFRQYAPWEDSIIASYESGTNHWPGLKDWYLYCMLDDNLAASPIAEKMITQFISQPWGFKTYFTGTSGNDALIGTQYADYFVGSTGLDSALGGLGNDIFLYRSGKTHYDGGEGHDIVKVEAARSGFTLNRYINGELKLQEGATDNYVLTANVERIIFTNNEALALDIQGIAGQAYRLYKAALNRTPDGLGLAGWISYMDRGGPLPATAQMFIDSPEFIAKYGALDDRNFVNQLYLNVLNRNAEPEGLAGWLQAFANGASRAQVLVGFSESIENQANVIGQIKNGIAYTELG